MSPQLNTPYQFDPRPNLICAGQPDAAGFQAAAQAGVVAVMNLRPDEEMDWDEAALIKELGLDYLQIPVSSPADLSQDNARQLNAWLEQYAGKPVLVHCASSNRVGALLALGAFLQGASGEQALQLGRDAGLTRMEPMVASLMQQWAA
ncbi:hypothetical protein ATO7_01395 [Oceanococcus atlanticus]|uniref:Beta-lactamase hydrolase-like protein phosphatase-like domain-containing protein n=1 Tax=Oceanococcus atlanticus TaxID=1317117 RepID=A0A1Y1SFX4_9GAMM|nr:sulfur transferase domain-containing protein [Oceanococcus atlanticus]ORE88488.1 hypothetical protein ATO7_01395 [Oceanococcus atlanticus]RZO85440.1 MAG: hypothetical protein EVA65_06150 [Oceanococcus sp.]